MKVDHGSDPCCEKETGRIAQERCGCMNLAGHPGKSMAAGMTARECDARPAHARIACDVIISCTPA
jgi:hypothetical protein